jgi:YfiH family protein
MSVAWRRAEWPAAPGIVAGCTLRTGGVSRGVYRSLNLGAHVGDDPQAVAENRRRFLADTGLPAEPAWLDQVHGSAVAVDPAPGVEADACYTTRTGAVCAVLVADCLPVLLTAADGSELAAAHAGWRGLAAGVLENTIAGFRSDPGAILAWLGPAISQAAFEVGDDVRDAFLVRDARAAGCFLANDRGRWQADLYGLARRRLSAAGVTKVFGGDSCTCADTERFFSYRRDGQCGRMAAFICRMAENA